MIEDVPHESDQATSPLRRFRLAHERDVVAVLRTKGPRTRLDLQNETGLSRTTLSDIVNELVQRGVISEARDASSQGRGRPRSILSLDPTAAHVVGLEIGRRHIGVEIANLAHEVVVGEDRAHAFGSDADSVATAALDVLSLALQRGSLTTTRLEAVVIGLPLSLDGSSTQMVGLRAQLTERLLEAYGVAPHFENNARLTALAETRTGAGAGTEDLLYFHLDTGVGGGIVIDGQIVDGRSGRAGEFGHISVDAYGPPCWCGGTGCLERFVSLPALLEAAGVMDAEALQSPSALEAIADRTDLLARTIAGAMSTLDIPVAVIGGAVGRLPSLAQRLAQRVKACVPDHLTDIVEVRTARLGVLGSARGGVILGLARTPDEQHRAIKSENLTI